MSWRPVVKNRCGLPLRVLPSPLWAHAREPNCAGSAPVDGPCCVLVTDSAPVLLMATWETYAPPLQLVPRSQEIHAVQPVPLRCRTMSEVVPVRPPAGEMVKVVHDQPPEPVGTPRA